MESLRKGEPRLFIAIIKPHGALTPSTIACWLKSILEAAGIDTSIFNAHSVRGASTSKAANVGITIHNILKAADWKSGQSSKSFTISPPRLPHMGVRCSEAISKLQRTPLICETEPSEV